MAFLYDRKFLFDHLPKTGGTAFRSVLEDIFGRENVTQHLEGRSEIWAVQRFSGIGLIAGHFLSLIPGEDRWFGRVRLTLLRDPIDRSVSEYFYWRHHAHEGVADKLGQWAQKFDICDFFKAREESDETGASNFYAKHFASRISRDLGDPARVLALALRSLENYDFVGVYEYLHDSVDMFCWQFRLPAVKQIPLVNVTASRLRVTDLDRRTRDQLSAMNDLDVQLYAFALQAFEAKKRRMIYDLLARRHERRQQEFHGSRSDQTSAPPAVVSNGGAAVTGGVIAQAPLQSPRFLRKDESFGSREVEIVAAQVIGSKSGSSEVAPGEEVSLCISISAHADIPDLTVGFDISDSFGEVVFGTNTYLREAVKTVVDACDYDVIFKFDANLNRGRYSVGAALHTGANHTDRCFHWRDHVTEFDVVQLGEPNFIGYCRLEPKIEWWDHPSVAGLPEPQSGNASRESATTD